MHFPNWELCPLLVDVSGALKLEGGLSDYFSHNLCPQVGSGLSGPISCHPFHGDYGVSFGAVAKDAQGFLLALHKGIITPGSAGVA